MSPRIVTVFGATGTQGSSIVSALLADGTFTPRAVTRDPTSEKAQSLRLQGVEVVQGDHWDVPSLVNAMNGAEAVFGVTNFWDPKNLAQGPTSDYTLGKNMVDAAVQAGVKFFVWSSLPHIGRLSQGKYTHVYHFDCKANVEDYLRETGLPHVNLHTGWFNENLWNLKCLTRTSDSSSYEINIPLYELDAPQYFTWVAPDLGQSVLALLKNYNNASEKILGETFYAVSDKMSYTEYAQRVAKALGRPVRFVSVPATGTAELDEMYAFQSEIGFYPNTMIPDPRLERLGVTFHSNETFAQEGLKEAIRLNPSFFL